MPKHPANRSSLILLAAMLCAMWATVVLAQTTAFTYQGQLNDNGNLANGPYDLQFRLFDAVTGGTQQGPALGFDDVQVSNGIFKATMDFGVAAFTGGNRWLEISLRPGASTHAFTTLIPRQQLTSSPYSVRSLLATSADGLSAACVNCVTSTQIGSLPAGSGNYIQNSTTLQASSNYNISGNGFIGGNFGVGTTTPTDKLNVRTSTGNYGFTHTDGTATVGSWIGSFNNQLGGWYGTKSNHPLHFFVNNGDPGLTITANSRVGIGTTSPGKKLTIQTPSFNFGLSHTDGTVEVGTFVSGSSGGWLQTHSNHPLNFATNNSSAQMTLATNGNLGVGTTSPGKKLTVQTGDNYGFSHTNGTVEVGSYVNANGGWLQTHSNHPLNFATNNGPAQMTLTTSGNIGIGTTSPIERLHVKGSGRFESNTGTGLTVVSSLAGNAALRAYAPHMATPTNIAIAVLGDAIPSEGYAGFFVGNAFVDFNMEVVGSLFAGAKFFKIDHPLDPENKYLHHISVESPDMMNIYNGVVTLDQFGQAEVTLPDYFQALNRDFRYQLTAIGLPGPNLYIAQKVENNRFRIAGGTLGMEVSWQVTGIRQDAFANKNRVKVEEMKSEKERSSYLHPVAFGQPEEKGVKWALSPDLMKQIKEGRKEVKLGALGEQTEGKTAPSPATPGNPAKQP